MYTNPLSRRNFADPFVLKWNGRYYAYGTGGPENGRAYPMMSSDDLVHWNDEAGALIPLDDPHAREYWAPEVCYVAGVFYMYYAVIAYGTPEHHLRVATSESPLGPFQDCGINLTPDEIFAIDAHPYQDNDGQRYLFYARDFLEPPFVGTGLAVDRLVSMTQLSRQPARVLRPFAAWQLYEKQRAEKGGMDWYTAEGPFVLRRHGKYVCLYSGGAWQFPNYGVADAVSDVVMGERGLEDRSYQDHFNEGGPLLLRTLPQEVLGPGHNSVVRGPNNVEEWIVYHGWDPEATHRMLRIDRLFWHGDRPFCAGATVTPQQAPSLPVFRDLVDRPESDEPGPAWENTVGWGVRAGAIRPLVPDVPPLVARLSVPENFVLELGVRIAEGDAEPAGLLLLGPLEHRITINRRIAETNGFWPGVWNHIRILKRGFHLETTLNGRPFESCPVAAGLERGIALFGGPSTSFCGIELTPYYADGCYEAGSLTNPGLTRQFQMSGRWFRLRREESRVPGRSVSCTCRLEQRDHQAEKAILPRGDAQLNLELSVELEFLAPAEDGSKAGLLLGNAPDANQANRVLVERTPSGWAIVLSASARPEIRHEMATIESKPLPHGTLRVRVQEGRTRVFWDERLVLEGEISPTAGTVALFTSLASASFADLTTTGLP